MNEIFVLIFAHCIGDIVFQSEFIAKNKGEISIVMIWHSIIWTGCICIALQFFVEIYLWEILFLFIGHYICDLWKCKSTKKFPSLHLYLDQIFHLLQILMVYYI